MAYSESVVLSECDNDRHSKGLYAAGASAEASDEQVMSELLTATELKELLSRSLVVWEASEVV